MQHGPEAPRLSKERRLVRKFVAAPDIYVLLEIVDDQIRNALNDAKPYVRIRTVKTVLVDDVHDVVHVDVFLEKHVRYGREKKISFVIIPIPALTGGLAERGLLSMAKLKDCDQQYQSNAPLEGLPCPLQKWR